MGVGILETMPFAHQERAIHDAYVYVICTPFYVSREARVSFPIEENYIVLMTCSLVGLVGQWDGLATEPDNVTSTPTPGTCCLTSTLTQRQV